MHPGVRSIPRPTHDQRLVVYGDLCLPRLDEIEIVLGATEIRLQCGERDFVPGTVFISRMVAGQVRRPGIQALLAVLPLPGIIGVVTPGIGHLSTDADVLATLRQLIEDTNSELLCMAGGA